MIDIENMVSALTIPDGMTVDEMRSAVVSALDIARASNEDEKAIRIENETLKKENDRLSRQNLELFNRVTTSLTPPSLQKEEEGKEKEEITTDDILSYYK